jgi:hypothetical protein
VNSFNTAEQAASNGEARPATAPARRPEMPTWQGYDTPRLEQARLLLSDTRWRASGRMVAAAGETEPFNASFELSVSEAGKVNRLLLRTSTVEEERHLAISHTDDGDWLVDRGQGAEKADFDGAVDVDVQFAVLFNAIPIRRLGLHLEAAEHVLPVVYVSLPDLSVKLVRQTYRTVSVGDDQSVVNYASGDFSQDITVDRQGLVLDYPQVSHRI